MRIDEEDRMMGQPEFPIAEDFGRLVEVHVDFHCRRLSIAIITNALDAIRTTSGKCWIRNTTTTTTSGSSIFIFLALLFALFAFFLSLSTAAVGRRIHIRTGHNRGNRPEEIVHFVQALSRWVFLRE
jgi:hypothetical protein